MTTLATFAAGLAVVLAAAVGVGAAVGPLGADTSAREHGPASGAGAPAARGLAVSQDGHTLALEPARFAAGRPGSLAFRILGPDGQPVTDYEIEHEKELHLVVVRRDATGFQHVHPARDPQGRWTTPLTLAEPGTHKVFADFVPAGADRPLTLATDVTVPGDVRPAELAAEQRTSTVDGYTVRVDGDLVAGTSSRLRFTVTRDGAPVRDLQPYLGAGGHLVALRAGDLAYLHVHPEGEPDDGGPTVDFAAEVPSASAYRLFLDFRHGDQVRTAAFGAVARTAAVDGTDDGTGDGTGDGGPHGSGH